MKTNRLAFLVNLYTFCIGTIFILPVITPYYQDHLGLSFRDLMIGEAVFAAVILLMEVPSGWLSDVWSRRHTLMLGTFVALIGYTIILHAQGFWSAILGQGLLGISVACNSGTVTSLLYDALEEQGQTDQYRRLESQRHAVGLYAVALGAVAGGFLYAIDGRLPLILDIVTCAMALLAVFFMVEPKRLKKPAEHSPLHDMIVTMKYALHGHKEITGIILVSTFLFCTTKMFMWAQQPYMQMVGIETVYFGYIIAGGFLFGGLVSQIGHRIETTTQNRRMIAMLASVPVIATILAVLIPVKISIVFILIVSGVWGYGFPFVQNAINKHADPTRRATILSSLGLLISLMFIPASIIMGYLDDVYDIRYALVYLAGQLTVFSAIGLWLWARGTRERL